MLGEISKLNDVLIRKNFYYLSDREVANFTMLQIYPRGHVHTSCKKFEFFYEISICCNVFKKLAIEISSE